MPVNHADVPGERGLKTRNIKTHASRYHQISQTKPIANRDSNIMSDTGPVLVTENLTKKYGEFTALDNLSITVNRGQILGFIGHNGAGKTTAIRILVGLARPTSGRATITGVDCLRDSRKIKKLVGYMPDSFGSYENMRVREYLDFFGAAFGIRRKERRTRIDEVLELTSSAWMQDRYVEALSHGMQQRIGIARTLLHDPEVLILDEPANGLDPEARLEMRSLLLRLASLGKTLIVTSHILPELSRICDQVAILHRGQLKAFGSLEEITRQFRQNRMIEVQLSGAEKIDETVEVLTASGTARENVFPSGTESIVRFRSDISEDELGSILAKLVAVGIPVTQFREVASDLEEAFLSVTRSGDAEAEAASEAEPEKADAELAAATESAGDASNSEACD
jgi:ABC-2 type transport system ATP-binding protein